MNRNKFSKDFFSFDFEESLGELANIKLPDPVLLDYYKRLSKREIYINDDIDESIVDYYQQILDWNREDRNTPIDERKKIKFFINSNGGCLNSINMIISAIQLSKTPVITIGLGKCYSSGGLLLMSAKKGNRFIFPNCEVLIHDGQTGIGGNMGKVLDSFEFTKANEVRVRQYILDSTNISEELYDRNYRKDWWIFSNEAITLGVADKIITDLDEIL